jgi:putative endonuclease
MTQTRKNTGKRGEALAAGFLRQRAYHILDTNWRTNSGEIDIIAQKDKTLVFVEVRTRRATSTETAFASITPAKRAKLIKSAYAYLNTHSISDDTPWRIDVIAVALWHGQPPQIEHVEDALGW